MEWSASWPSCSRSEASERLIPVSMSMNDAPVSHGHEIRLASLLGALSLATDRGAGFPEETALRTAILARRLAHRLDGPGGVERDAYWSGLLRFLGCTAYAH